MDVNAFYSAVTTASFTLLGLWWVVVQARPEWRREASRRRLAYAIMLHFLLPGLMAMLSLVAPDVPGIWHIAFLMSGVAGIVGVAYVLQALQEDRDCPRVVRYLQWIALPAYVVVALVAAAPGVIGMLVAGLTPLQVEGITLTVILFLGAQSAAVLLVEPDRLEGQTTRTT